MNKKLLTLFAASIFLFTACGGTSSTPNSSVSTTDPVQGYNSLQKMFYTLAHNSFTVDYEMSYASQSGIITTQQVKYTDYAIESDGYLGFHSVAQGDELVFPYTRSADGKINSLAPTVDYYSGLRYMDIADYQVTFKSLNIDEIVVTEEDGYFIYDYSSNTAENNEALNSLTMLYSGGSANPSSLRFRVVGNSLVSEGVGIVYDETHKDTVTARFYNVGNTEIEDVKEYLDNGGTAKDYVDDRFVAFMLPWFVSTNYTVYVDLKDVAEYGPGSTVDIRYTDDTEFHVNGDDERKGVGYVEYQGVVMQYNVDQENNVDFVSAYMASSSEVCTDLWNERIGMSFLSVSPSNLIGYKDVVDNKTVYHITDTQFISAIANLATAPYDDSYMVDDITITVDDMNADTFSVEFDYYDRASKVDKGTGRLTFKDLNKTNVKAVDRLLKTGEDASTQSKDEFMEMMNLFSTHNYSEYLYGEGNFDISKYVYNKDYNYAHTNSSLSGGVGYISSDGVKQFTLATGDDDNLEVSLQSNFNAVLPGTGYSFNASNDLAYMSAPTVYKNRTTVDEEATAQVREDLYNPESYVVSSVGDLSVWANTKSSVLAWSNTYFASILGNYYTPFMVGFQTCKKADNEVQYDMNKVTFYLFVYENSTGNELWTSFTYFDVGHSNIDVIDNYLNQ